MRATLPRLRYDQLMAFGWKVLLPIATLNAVVTAVILAVRSRDPAGRSDADAKGFAVTFRQIFRKPITQAVPRVQAAGLPALPRAPSPAPHENGLEKCVGCSLCAAACPADCIRVVAAENDPDDRVSPGERYARIYEINMSRCIFCGYCEMACPFDAITLGNEYELSEYHRDDQIYTKEMLLEPPVKRVPVADRELYDTPEPVWKSATADGHRRRDPRLDRLDPRGHVALRLRRSPSCSSRTRSTRRSR